MHYINNDRHRRSAFHLLWDISGAFGDIGVLFPLAIALIAKNGFNPTMLFLMAGMFYILSARYFRITMPVQPLKAMAAIAIVSGLDYHVINAAGIVMGIILIMISVSGLSVALGRLFPVSVIRGIQLGLGMILVRKSFDMMYAEPAIAFTVSVILLTSIALLKKIPPLLPVILIAIIAMINRTSVLMLGPVMPSITLPDYQDIWTGFVVLVLPQIALTFGNAIVATEATAKLLYGKRARRLNFKNIPMSMGIANIVSGICGGAPMCHGSGGLTAHNKFGATTEKSGYIIGGLLIVLAVGFGDSVPSIVSAFPAGILGVLLCYVGIQHAFFIKDIVQNRFDLLVAVTVAMTGFIMNNLTAGFVTGLVLFHIFQFTYRRLGLGSN